MAHKKFSTSKYLLNDLRSHKQQSQFRVGHEAYSLLNSQLKIKNKSAVCLLRFVNLRKYVSLSVSACVGPKDKSLQISSALYLERTMSSI